MSVIKDSRVAGSVYAAVAAFVVDSGRCFVRLAVAAGSLIGVAALPTEAIAIENYAGNVVGQCEDHNGVGYNVVASVTAPNWYVSGLEYVFTPVPAQSSQIDVDPKTRYFLVSPGTYTVAVGNIGFTVDGPGHQGKYTITAPDCSPPRKGMTWRLVSTNSPSGTIRVGCGNNECDPRQGDTVCTAALPLLCIRRTGAGFPLPLPATIDNTSRYNKWSGGIVGTTSATVPPATLAEADALCAQQFGASWRVAEFHDGWGWYFQAYGGVGDPSSRFWVHINDQPDGTCWH